MYSEDKKQKCIELRKQNKSMQEIADLLNISISIVSKWCIDAGMGGSRAPRTVKHLRNQYTIKGIDNQISEACCKYVEGKPWKYVNGFVDVDSQANFECLNCGHIQSIPFQCFRQKQRTAIPLCKVCQERKRKEEKEKRLIKQIEERLDAKEQKRINKLRARPKLKKVQRSLAFNICDTCGTTFLASNNNRKYCSVRCCKTRKNQKHERRIKKEAIVDRDITIQKLYKRDSGICYLCGNVCDWSDKEEINGTIICGDNYPSIDHVIPLARGGLHSWDNVKLAHRSCNTKKRDELIFPL